MMKPVIGQIEQLKKIVCGLPLNAFMAQRAAAEHELNGALLETAVFEQPGHDADEQRDALVRIRSHVSRLREKLAVLQTAVAEQYRGQLGAGKAAFEQLDADVQAVRDPAAYETRRLFHALEQAREVCSLLAGRLLDIDAVLERAARPVPAGADSYDSDPAPSPVSP
ncbi:hypothetical protein B5M42_013220 [Paenibacillus athensensis]|nr:hypothetical protein [Paenibacillus athensensis]MCD1259796.1 hypothetical protein [Paenibacillus athensensis]